MSILRYLHTVEKDIKHHFGIDNCKLTYNDEIQLIFYGYDERMEDIAQYCKQQLEAELEKTFILHHCQSWEQNSEENTQLYRFTQKEQ